MNIIQREMNIFCLPTQFRWGWRRQVHSLNHHNLQRISWDEHISLKTQFRDGEDPKHHHPSKISWDEYIRLWTQFRWRQKKTDWGDTPENLYPKNQFRWEYLSVTTIQMETEIYGMDCPPNSTSPKDQLILEYLSEHISDGNRSHMEQTTQIWVEMSKFLENNSNEVDPLMHVALHTYMPAANIHNFSISGFPDFHTSSISAFYKFIYFKEIWQSGHSRNTKIWCAIFYLSLLDSVLIQCVTLSSQFHTKCITGEKA